MSIKAKVILWQGRYSSVSQGLWNTKTVAVKQIRPGDINRNECNAIKFLSELQHDNIVRLYHAEMGEIFKFYALELCIASLDQAYLDDPRRYGRNCLPPKEDILLQLANGMKYIHDCGLVYLKAKPQSALIYYNTDPMMKWADFGLSKWFLDVFDPAVGIETSIDIPWMAPETVTALRHLIDGENTEHYDDKLLEMEFGFTSKNGNNNKSMKAADVFSEGLVFVYVLLDGTCPGLPYKRMGRFSPEEFNSSYIKKIQHPLFRYLLRQMLTAEPTQRIDSTEVVERIKCVIRNEKVGDDFYVNPSSVLGENKNGPIIYGTWQGRAVAVEQIQSIHPQTEDLLVRTLRSLDHENVVKLLHVEQDCSEIKSNYYYAFELCQASLDHYFLDDGDPKKFRGPMPFKKNIFLGLAQGMEYLHNNRLIFDSITPKSVLISLGPKWRQDSKAKWSTSSLLLNKGDESIHLLSEEEVIWKAPELMTDNAFAETIESNVFSVGLVFAYILLDGKHLYDSSSGDRRTIKSNIVRGKRVNLHKIQVEHFRQLVNEMVSHESASRITFRNSIQKMKLYVNSSGNNKNYQKIDNCDVILKQYNKLELGKGGYGFVFYGTYSNSKKDNIPKKKFSVAVKRIELNHFVMNEREEEALKGLTHRNVIRLFHATGDEYFRYFALELCQATLNQLFLDDNNERKYRGPMPHSKNEVLYQLAKGLEYIHSKQLTHRDIKPANALIWVGYDETGTYENQVLMKWADFGLSKRVNERGTCSWSGMAGTWKWEAPEVLKMREEIDKEAHRNTTKSDVFAEGLVFGYFLLDGKHPYGFDREVMDNIVRGKIVNIRAVEGTKVQNLLEKMLAHSPKDRISSSEVVEQLRYLRNQQLDTVDLELAHLCAGPKPTLKEIETLLTMRNANVDCIDEDGLTPFFQLIQNRNFDSKDLVGVTPIFIEKSMNVNFRTKTKQNALHFLCKHRSLDDPEDLIKIMQLLIANGIDVNCKNNGQKTALHVLCRTCVNENLIKILKFLAEKGLFMGSSDKQGWNALHHVCENYHHDDILQIIQCFIERKVKIDSTTNNGENILHILCRKYNNDQLINVIRFVVDPEIDSHIDVNCKNNEGKNAYDILVDYNKDSKELLNLFLQHGMTTDHSSK